MPLQPIATSWEQEIHDGAVEEFDGEIEVRKPGTPGTPGSFDPVTGTKDPDTPGDVVLSRRAARAQQIRLPLESSDGNSWQTRRRYRFQCEILPGDPSVTKGLVVKFFGGRDPELPKMTFQVSWATNSSHAPVRTIETLTEGSRG